MESGQLKAGSPESANPGPGRNSARDSRSTDVAVPCGSDLSLLAGGMSKWDASSLLRSARFVLTFPRTCFGDAPRPSGWRVFWFLDAVSDRTVSAHIIITARLLLQVAGHIIVPFQAGRLFQRKRVKNMPSKSIHARHWVEPLERRQLLSAGLLDTTFGSKGFATVSKSGFTFFGDAVAPAAQGKIIVAGLAFTKTQSFPAVARYNPDGSVDKTFAPDHSGLSISEFTGTEHVSVAIQSDGKIVVACTSKDTATDGSPLTRAMLLRLQCQWKSRSLFP